MLALSRATRTACCPDAVIASLTPPLESAHSGDSVVSAGLSNVIPGLHAGSVGAGRRVVVVDTDGNMTTANGLRLSSAITIAGSGASAKIAPSPNTSSS